MGTPQGQYKDDMGEASASNATSRVAHSPEHVQR